MKKAIMGILFVMLVFSICFTQSISAEITQPNNEENSSEIPIELLREIVRIIIISIEDDGTVEISQW